MKYNRYPLLTLAPAQEDITSVLHSHISQCRWRGCCVCNGTHKIGEKCQGDPFGPYRRGKDLSRPWMALAAGSSDSALAGREIFSMDLPDKRGSIDPLIEHNVYEDE